MSKAALCATRTVSLAKAWKAGSTCSMVGWPCTISGWMPWMGMDAAGIDRPVSRTRMQSNVKSCSNDSCLISLPLSTRVAPIWMISSPSDGLRPVVSVSNTV